MPAGRRSPRFLAARRAFAVSLLLLALSSWAAVPGAKPESPPPFAIRWTHALRDTNRVTITVEGLSPAEVAALKQANWPSTRWQRLLAVRAEQGDVLAGIGIPPMLGTHRVDAQGLHFEPQFALVPGLTYQASFHPDQLPGGSKASEAVVSSFQTPRRTAGPPAFVRQVYPTADVLPENLLKFYLYFSAPMSRGHIYEHIHLKEKSGRVVELPFLEIDEELWNPDMTRLTLFIDPGRVKREVQPLEEIGPALVEGKEFALIIGREWQDAQGQPLKESFTKHFRVGPPARNPIDPAQWKLAPPASATREALTIRFPISLDHALAQRLIRVRQPSGEAVEGSATLQDQERVWRFAPARNWNAGDYQITVPTTIEDLAGNNIGKSFEVDLLTPVQRRITNSIATIPFKIE